jgi:hypothetical protein
MRSRFSNIADGMPPPPARPAQPVKAPSPLALLLGLIPFAAMCFSVPLWDRLDPMILGVPFNLAWLLCWIVLTSLCMWAAYPVEVARETKHGGRR